MEKVERREKIRKMIKGRGRLGALAESWGVSRYRLSKLTDDLPDGTVLAKFVTSFPVDPSDFWTDEELNKIRSRSGDRGRPTGSKTKKKKTACILVEPSEEYFSDSDYIDDDLD